MYSALYYPHQSRVSIIFRFIQDAPRIHWRTVYMHFICSSTSLLLSLPAERALQFAVSRATLEYSETGKLKVRSFCEVVRRCTNRPSPLKILAVAAINCSSIILISHLVQTWSTSFCPISRPNVSSSPGLRSQIRENGLPR